MGSVGDAYDNAMAESFFATLECELLNRRRFKSQAEARIAVFEFIEDFYNPRRRPSSLEPFAFLAAQPHNIFLYRNLLRSHDCLHRPTGDESESRNPCKLVEAAISAAGSSFPFQS
jgi:hypothetical protein